MKKFAVVATVVLLFAVCSMASALQWNHVSSPGLGRMAVDPNGNLWLEARGMLSKWVDNHWETETLPQYYFQRYNVIFSPDGQPHVIGSSLSGSDDSCTIRYLSKTASGWESEIITTNADYYAESCSGTFDTDGNAYIAYVTQPDSRALYLAKRSNDGTWSNNLVEDGYNTAWWPDVKIDPNGRIWVAYTTGATDDLKVAYKWPEGAWAYMTLDSNGVTGWQPRLEIDENGRKTFAYYNDSAGTYQLIYERANGTLARVTAPGKTDECFQFDMTLMDDNTPLLAYTLNPSERNNTNSPIYCAWYNSSDAPFTFQVGDGVIFDSFNDWDYRLDAQAIGNTLFINARYTNGYCETWWTTVPEPSSIIALFAGIAGLGMIRRRK